MTLLGQVPTCCNWSKSFFFFICRKLPLLVHLKVYRRILDGCLSEGKDGKKGSFPTIQCGNYENWKASSQSLVWFAARAGWRDAGEGGRECGCAFPAIRRPEAWSCLKLTRIRRVSPIHLGSYSESTLAAKQERQYWLGLVQFGED